MVEERGKYVEKQRKGINSTITKPETQKPSSTSCAFRCFKLPLQSHVEVSVSRAVNLVILTLIQVNKLLCD